VRRARDVARRHRPIRRARLQRAAAHARARPAASARCRAETAAEARLEAGRCDGGDRFGRGPGCGARVGHCRPSSAVRAVGPRSGRDRRCGRHARRRDSGGELVAGVARIAHPPDRSIALRVARVTTERTADAARGARPPARRCARSRRSCSLMNIRLALLVLVCLAGAAHAQTPSDAERAAALEIYRKIVSFDTSVEGEQTPAMAAYLAGRFRAAGFAEQDVLVVPFASTASLAVRYRGDGTGGAALLLLAHMDVVPARREEWERDPFTLIEDDGFFFGRGSSDNKAGVALITSTFLRLRAAGFRPTRDVVLWF